jgi:hypothetical protein
MHDVYFWCAVIGGSVLGIQLLLQVIGLDGGDGDVDVDMDVDVDPAHGTAGNVFFGVLSVKALVAFLAVFGLVGLSLEDSSLSRFHRASIAVLAGLVAMLFVAWLMRTLHQLGSSGSVVLQNAVGHRASVYLRIPASGAGRGKVTVEIQQRTVELSAVTDGDAIETGQVVRILEVLPNETVRVERV